MWANAQRDGRPAEYRWRPLLEEVSMFNKYFPIVDICLSCEDTARQSCAIVHRWRFFCVLYFSASRTQHISDVHSKFALRPHHVWKYGRHPISDR